MQNRGSLLPLIHDLHPITTTPSGGERGAPLEGDGSQSVVDGGHILVASDGVMTGIRRRRLLLLLITTMLVGIGLYISDYEPFFTVIVLFCIVVPFEKLFPRHRGQKILRPRVATDVGYALAAPALNAFGLIVAIIIGVLSLAWIPGLLLRPVVAMIPPIMAPFVAFLLFDFVVYWAHRWYHEVPLLWRFHAIHHSTEHLDWASGFRAHPLDGSLIAPAIVFLLAAGFSGETTGAIAVIQIISGLFLHANVKWRLKPLHKVIITPEFHHWHHTKEPEAIWSNYSVFLPLWDIIFGTYFMPSDKRPSDYGVDEFIPEGIAAQLFHPLRGLDNPLTMVRHPWRTLKKTLKTLRKVLGQMYRSATRPRGHTPFTHPAQTTGFTPFPLPRSDWDDA